MDCETDYEDVLHALEASCKDGDMGWVAASVGHFVIDEDEEAVPYEGVHGRLGIKDVMAALEEFYPQTEVTSEGCIVSCGRPLSKIALGLGGQVTIQVAPMLSVSELEAEYKNGRYRLSQTLKPVDYNTAYCGYNPDAPCAKIPEMPLDIDPLPEGAALQLQKAVTGIKVVVDYADEADAVRKLRIASLLSPILAFIAENAPVYEGEPDSQPLRCFKVRMGACGGMASVPGLFADDFGFEKYASWAAGNAACALALPVSFERGISLRMADSMPKDPAFGYVALVKGLFYGPVSLELFEHVLGLDGTRCPYNDESVAKAADAIVENGYNSQVYGRSVNDWIDLLFRLAPDGLGTEYGYLEKLKDYKGL